MAWAVAGLMYPSRPVVRPDSSSILLSSTLLMSCAAKQSTCQVFAGNCKAGPEARPPVVRVTSSESRRPSHVGESRRPSHSHKQLSSVACTLFAWLAMALASDAEQAAVTVHQIMARIRRDHLAACGVAEPSRSKKTLHLIRSRGRAAPDPPPAPDSEAQPTRIPMDSDSDWPCD